MFVCMFANQFIVQLPLFLMKHKKYYIVQSNLSITDLLMIETSIIRAFCQVFSKVKEDGKKRRRPPQDVVLLGEREVEISMSARYLGVWFDSKLNFALHVQTQRSKATAVLAALIARSSGFSVRNKMHLYKASRVAQTDLKGLQTLQNRGIKRALGVPLRTPTVDIHKDTGTFMVAECLGGISERFFVKCSGKDVLIRELTVVFGQNHVPP